MKKLSDVQGYFDLDYVLLVGVPTKKTKFGEVVDLPPAVVERRIAEEIIRQRVPLRGREIAFLRKSVGYSYEKFAHIFGRSAGSVFHWEKTPDKRLDQLAEAAMRSLFAESLEIELRGWFHELLGEDKTPKSLEVEMKKVA